MTLICYKVVQENKFHLWSTVIGQSASVYKHQTKRRRCWLSKVYFQCESAYFQKKNLVGSCYKVVQGVAGSLMKTSLQIYC